MIIKRGGYKAPALEARSSREKVLEEKATASSGGSGSGNDMAGAGAEAGAHRGGRFGSGGGAVSFEEGVARAVHIKKTRSQGPRAGAAAASAMAYDL